MESNVLWEKLCNGMNVLLKAGITREEDYHKVFEEELKSSFKWPHINVRHEPSVKMGSEYKNADIVLEGKDFGIIIEMKSPLVKLGKNEEEQLDSYLNNYYTTTNKKKCKFGLIVGNVIKVYYKNDPDEAPELKASFGFDVNSPAGNALSEILFYDNCSEEKLNAFMNADHEILPDEPQKTDDPKPPLPGNDIFTDAINELRKVAEFLEGKGFEMKTRKTPYFGVVYISSNVISNTTNGVDFVINKKPNKPTEDRYGFEYETKNEALNGLEEKQKEIRKRFGISEFRPGKRNKAKGRIVFKLVGDDPGNEALEIIAKTSRIIGFPFPKEMKSWYNDWYNKNNSDSLKDILWPEI